MNENALSTSAKMVEKEIKIALLKHDSMSQIKLADLIGEGTSQVNRAIKGDMSPKSIRIREKIYMVLNIDDK